MKTDKPSPSPYPGNILIIDDDKSNLEVLQDILSFNGYQSTAAFSGREGIRLFQKKKFALVFTDLLMPKMSGWEVAKRIKEIDPQTPVILVTGWGIQLDEQNLKKAGITSVIYKPYDFDHIIELLERLLFKDV